MTGGATRLEGASGAVYRLSGGPVASGGQALVYRGVAEDDDRDVAVKVSLAGGDDAERLIAQCSRLRALGGHPAIGPATVPVWDHGRWDDRAFFVMDWLPQTLLSIRDAPAADRVSWARRLLDVVDRLAQSGVVHGDLKPSNVLIAGPRGEEELLLADFGDLASGQFTPGHAPPEQIAGGPPSIGWDRFALAVAIWQMLAREAPTGPLLATGSARGREPVVGRDRVALETALPAGRAVRAALEAHLDPDPARRPEGLQALRAALACWPDVPPSAKASPTRIGPGATGQVWVALGSAVALCVAAVALGARTSEGLCPSGTVRDGRICTFADGRAFVRVPAGRFVQGRAATDPLADTADAEPHPVEITRPFLIGVTEVTQAEWAAVTGENPVVGTEMIGDGFVILPCDSWHGTSTVGDDFPAVCVTWYEIIVWLNERSAADGLDPAYQIEARPPQDPLVTWDPDADGWRLPTEAEWEYAARAGTHGRFGERDDIPGLCARANLRDASALEMWGNELPCSDGFPVLAPVGSYPANAWGLRDAYGNVVEWVWDLYGAYPEEAVVDPTGPKVGAMRAGRGSSWNHVSKGIGARYPSVPTERAWSFGFRAARNAP